MSTPIISVAQMREWEHATWADGETEAQVIQQVGLQVARQAEQLTAASDAILLLAGKGHNGDDVRAAYEFISGHRAELLEIKSPTADLARLEAALAQGPALIVDGLFGIGLNRPLDAAWINFINRINAAGIPILAVDVPSGLNADTGEHFGAAIQATMTVTVGAPKRGLLSPNVWPFVGRLHVATEIGLIPCPHAPELRWTLPEDFSGFPPRRPIAGHKGTFGHLAIIAGSIGYHGAAVLATHGAQRAQPGLVTVLTQKNVYPPIAAQLQSAMVDIWSQKLRRPEDFTAILTGPGLAAVEGPQKMILQVRKLWQESTVPMIVDASALDWLVTGASKKNSLRVITPHPGEAARLLKTTPQQVQQDRAAAVRSISQKYGDCWVVLKGHQTLVGRSKGEIFVNPSGNPHLAQGGSGDVLAGFIAGLLAQPALQTDAGQTLRYAVWQHGATADALQKKRPNWTIEDLVDELGATQ